MFLDVDITHGLRYGHPLLWKQRDEFQKFFLPYSGLGGMDRGKCAGHLSPPARLYPASVQIDVDEEKFEDIFVALLSC
jgi:hypothetical protein